MRRFYSIDKYMAIVNQFRNAYPDFNFTTDVIVGFPGETEDEFQETCNIVRKIGFSHIHTFKYSRRTGTRADRMEDQLAEKIKNKRSKVIRSIAEEMKLNYRRQFLGQEQRLLVERNNSKGGARGYGEHYLPLVVKGKKLERNAFYPVRLIDILDDSERTMVAELV